MGERLQLHRTQDRSLRNPNPPHFQLCDPTLPHVVPCSPRPPSLQTLTLAQYQEAFIAAAVDGAFLYDLNDDDLKSSLGVEHRLHRKKILNSINRLKAAEAERVRPMALNSVSMRALSSRVELASANRDLSPLQKVRPWTKGVRGCA